MTTSSAPGIEWGESPSHSAAAERPAAALFGSIGGVEGRYKKPPFRSGDREPSEIGASRNSPPLGFPLSGSPSGSSSTPPGFRHPVVLAFHVLFKALALLMFLFGSFLFGGWHGDYVFTFVTTTIFLALDFWTVKNVTGRVLVGMRWHSNLRSEDGASEWVYERRVDKSGVSVSDEKLFWLFLWLWPLLWAGFAIGDLISLQLDWLFLAIIGLVLAGLNLVAYFKCWHASESSSSFLEVAGQMTGMLGLGPLVRGVFAWAADLIAKPSVVSNLFSNTRGTAPSDIESQI